MKRIIAIALALLLCLGAGCAHTPDASSTPMETPAAAASPQPTPQPTPEPEPMPTPESGPPVYPDKGEFSFTRENFPKMDGSTATEPLAQAAAAVLLGESVDSVSDLTWFSRTTQSYYQLGYSNAQILIAAEPGDEAVQWLDRNGHEIIMEPLAIDALIFVVNENNPIDSLTREQIIGIYTGQITNWSQVGGADEEIKAFQRNEGAGSQTLMEKLVMGATPMMEPATEMVAGGMGELMEVVKSYDNSASAIGYSVYYYANDMQMAQGLKIIAVDGVQPNAETIGSGEYPYLNPYYTVIRADCPEDDPAWILWHWLLSPEGQRLVESEGYVPVGSTQGDSPAGGWTVGSDYSLYVSAARRSLESVYTRLSSQWIDALQPRDDYGMLYPFAGVKMSDDYSDTTYLYGLVDAQGRIVCDPVYTSVGVLSWYDWNHYIDHSVPMLCLARTENGETRYTLATPDGSFVSPESYGVVNALDCGVICGNKGSEDFVLYDYEGNIILTRDELEVERLGFYGSLYSIEPGGEGLLLVDTAELDGERYYADLSGKVVLGPYNFARPFENGRAIVSVDSGWGLIDRSGNWIIPPEWGEIRAAHSGQYKTDGRIFDAYGQELFTVSAKTYIGYYKGGGYILPDGTELGYAKGWMTLQGDWYGDGCPVLYKTPVNQSSMDLMDIRSGKTLHLEGHWNLDRLFVNYVNSGYSELEYVYAYNTDDIMAPPLLISWNLWNVYELKNSGGTAMGGATAKTDAVTGEEYIVINDSAYRPSLYSADMELLLEDASGLRIWGGMFIQTDDICCTIMDEEGNVLFRYALILPEV